MTNGALLPAGTRNGDGFTFDLASDRLTLAPPGERASILCPKPQGLMKSFEIVRGVRLLRGPWATALLGHLTTVTDGPVRVPLSRSADDGRVRVDDLEAGGFRVEHNDDESGPTGRIVGSHDPRSPSLLAWHYQRGADLLMTLSALVEGDAGADRVVETLLRTANGIGYIGKLWDQDSPATLGHLQTQYAYWFHGLSYKAPLINHILDSFGPTERPLRMVDLGGGPGVMAMELLRSGGKVSEAIVVEPNIALATIGSWIAGDLGMSETALTLMPTRMEAAAIETDVVTALASFLYVPAKARVGVLDSCWDALRPGGLLILHENIKSPRFREHEFMFTVPEIDGLLARYGDVVRVSSSAPRIVDAEQARDTTIFRCVIKSS